MSQESVQQREHPYRRMLSLIATGLLAIVAFGTVTLGVLMHVEHLQLETVLSGSMRPTVQPGDLAVVHEVATSSLHRGEVVAIYPPGAKPGSPPVMHRIIALDRSHGVTWVRTKGDANNIADPWGRVKLVSPRTFALVAVVPKLGFVSVYLNRLAHARLKQWAFIIAGIALALVAVLVLRRSRSAPAALPAPVIKGEKL